MKKKMFLQVKTNALQVYEKNTLQAWIFDGTKCAAGKIYQT